MSARFTCVWTLVSGCVCMCLQRPKVDIRNHFQLFSHLINLGRVSPSNPEPSNMMNIASHLALGTPLSLTSWVRNSDSNLHICMVNAFTTKSSPPWSCFHFWDIVLLLGPGMIFLLQPLSTGITSMLHTPGNKESSVRQSQAKQWLDLEISVAYEFPQTKVLFIITSQMKFTKTINRANV